MGLAMPIGLGGHCLTQPAVPEMPPDELEPLTGEDVNHGSLRRHFADEAVAAGVVLVQRSVEDGFGELFTNRATAEAALGGTVFPSPWAR